MKTIAFVIAFFSLLPASVLAVNLYSAVPVSDIGTGNSLQNPNSSRMVAADGSNNIYVVYHGSDGVRVARSTNRGQSFQPSVQITASNGQASIAVDSNGVVYVAYVISTTTYFSRSTDQAQTFSAPVSLGTLSGSSSVHISTDAPYVYVLTQKGSQLYVNGSSGSGAFTTVTTNLGTKVFSDVQVDPATGDVFVIGDSPAVTYSVSHDHGATFGSAVSVSGASVFYSTYIGGFGSIGRKVYMSGGQLSAGTGTKAYIIDLDAGTGTARTFANNTVGQSRTLAVDGFGNVADGYSDGSNVYYRISNDTGSTFGSAVQVATSSTRMELAINASFQDLIAVYEQGGKIYANTYGAEFVANADIAVTGNNTLITDGSTTVSTTNNTNFGDATVGTPVSKTFTITNAGGTALNLTGTAPDYVTLSGAGCTEFSITSQPASGTIAVLGDTTFTVQYNPAGLGSDTCTVSIASDDSDENPYDFVIQGNVPVPVTPEVIISGTPTATEGSTTGSYTLALSRNPTSGNVTVSLTPDSQCTVSPSSVSLSNTTAQTITVTAVDDTLPEGAHTCVIQHAITASDDLTNFPTTLAVANVTANITDNEHGVVITQSGGNTSVTEGGATDTYSVVLISQPASNVTVGITPNAQITVDSTSLTFTTSNWNVPQTITVTAVDDIVVEGSHNGNISHAITTGDGGNYPDTMAVASVTVSITDNDTPPPPPPISITHNLVLTVNGTGNGKISGTAAGTYDEGTTIKLTATPAADSIFKGWSPSSCAATFYLFTDTTCTATFETKPIAKATLTLQVIGQGTLSGTSAGLYPVGTNIQLVATPAANSHFISWSPANCAAFSIATDTLCVVTFEADTPPVNTPPVNILSFNDLLVTLGDADYQIDLTKFFKDAEDPVLSYSINNTQPSVINTTIQSNTLSLQFAQIGSSMIEIIAHDSGGLSTTEAFLVTIASRPLQPPVVPETPNLPITPTTPDNSNSAGCELVEHYQGVCNGKGTYLAVQHLTTEAVIANFRIDSRLNNEGFISDMQILPNGVVIGGRLSGEIHNQGIIRNVEFKGKNLEGGTLGGSILNSSPVYGRINHVHFEPCALAEGGYWGGYLTGNSQYPVYLNNLTLAADTVLENAIIGEGVRITGNTKQWRNVKRLTESQNTAARWDGKQNHNSAACFAPLQDSEFAFVSRPEITHANKQADILILAIAADKMHYSFQDNWQSIDAKVEALKVFKTLNLSPTFYIPKQVLTQKPDTILLFLGYRLSTGEIIYQQVE